MTMHRGSAWLLALVVLSGCGGGGDLFVRQVQLADSEHGCVATNDPAASNVVSGTLDLLYRSSYEGALLVGTELDERVLLGEVDVTVFDYAGSELSSYVLPAAGFIDSADDPRAGYGLVDATLLDRGAVEAAMDLEQVVVSRVQVHATTLDGDELVSEPWDFPILICRTTADAPDACLGCVASAGGAQPCRLGQDLPPDCATRDARLSR